MNVDDLQRFPLAFIRIHWGHSLDSPWEDYEMRKGLTRKPQRDEPATRGKNYLARAGCSASTMSTGFCSPGTARPWRRWWRGLPATAIAVRTPTISTASGGGRSMGGFAFSRSESKPRK